MYLRKKGLDVYCVEFKYFVNKTDNKMISSDFVVGDEEFIRTKISSSTQLPKTDKGKFVESLDNIGKLVFENIFKFAEQEKLVFRWGAKGFSLNLLIDNENISLCEGYPTNSVFKQSLYTNLQLISKKVNNSDSVVDFYRKELKSFGKFEQKKLNFKWSLEKGITISDIEKYLEILKKMIERIKTEGLKIE